MGGIRIKAVILGALVDVGGTLIAGTAFGVAVGILMVVRDGAGATRLAELQTQPWMLASGFFLGVAFSLLGGFVAGKVAQERQTLHGAITGLVTATAGVLLGLSLPPWYLVLGFLATPAAAALGGRFAAARG